MGNEGVEIQKESFKKGGLAVQDGMVDEIALSMIFIFQSYVHA